MKKTLILILCVAVLFMVCMPAAAHPGKTDSAGGHYDYSIGEYHYHHGYSAHDHEDMDGDGVVDCPYDFDDQTDRSSGSTNNSDSYIVRDYPKTITVYKDREVIKEVPVVPQWAIAALGISAALILVLVLILWFYGKHKNREISFLRKSLAAKEADRQAQKTQYESALRQKECMDEQARQKETQETDLRHEVSEKDLLISSLTQENETLKNEMNFIISSLAVGEPYYPKSLEQAAPLYRIELPPDVYFVDDHIPAKGYTSSNYPYGDYSAFTTEKSKVFHTAVFCCRSNDVKLVHLFDVLGKKRPCSKCCKNCTAQIPKWYTDLQTLKEKTKRNT